MTALYVIAGIVLALWLISLLRVGGIVEYSADGVEVQLRIGPFRVELFPGKPKEEKSPKHKKGKKPKKEKKAKQKKPPKEKPPVPLKEKVGGALSLFRELLPVGLEAAEKLFRRLRVDELVLHLTWAADDPADAVMGYGAAQAALAALLPPLERCLHIRERDVGAAVDFQLTEPIIYARGSLSFTVGQLTTLGVAAGVKALRGYLRVRRARPSGHAGAPKKKTEDLDAVNGGNGKEGTLS